MKNQNDLIAWIVSGVLTIIMVVICFAMIERTPVQPTPPQTVAIAPAALPSESPVLAAGLPQGSGSGGGMAGGGSGMPSFGGPGGGRGMGRKGGAPAAGLGGGGDQPMAVGVSKGG